MGRYWVSEKVKRKFPERPDRAHANTPMMGVIRSLCMMDIH